ncbi:hypothetical protein QC589_01510 [Halomonas elongata]|uniref:hypothetical protein n=1 Tax=Halomonas elongata TaxID=2746 RepID=UPI00255AC6E8|nr:hypothetical protein [Halomonas elongata]MDL4861438.1 hypothetical protein [Halomonas elongata]
MNQQSIVLLVAGLGSFGGLAHAAPPDTTTNAGYEQLIGTSSDTLSERKTEVRILPSGEIALFEVTRTAKPSEELQAWPPHAAEYSIHSRDEMLYSPIPENSGRQMSRQETEDLMSEISAEATLRAKNTALAFCESDFRPERVGATAGWAGGAVLMFNATWNLDALCPEDEAEATSESLNTSWEIRPNEQSAPAH